MRAHADPINDRAECGPGHMATADMHARQRRSGPSDSMTGAHTPDQCARAVVSRLRGTRAAGDRELLTGGGGVGATVGRKQLADGAETTRETKRGRSG